MNKDKIEELLTRGVDTIYPTKAALEKVLRGGKKLRVYQGFDPTGTQLHIGHMVGLKKLRQWQDLGHHVIFLIGDGTGQAGDPSGRTTARDQFLTQDTLRKNAVDYVTQAEKIVRFKGKHAAQILFNGDWLNKLNLPEILSIANHFTMSALAERDLYRERAKRGEEVSMREFMYPLLQAYDSVAMHVDIEIGGTDQTFNMLMGRHLVKRMQNREKFVMTTPLLTDSHGVKIGKTEGNVIALTDKPEDLYGKIMSLPDDVIVRGFEYLTDVPMQEVRTIRESLARRENPMPLKKRLAFAIVRQCASEKEAQAAQHRFERVSQERLLPKDIEQLIVRRKKMALVDFLTTYSLAASKGEARRLIAQGSVDVDAETIMDTSALITPASGTVVRVGKKKFVKLCVA